eukprot:SAG22_NODE_5183_length_1067_cov_8.330579_2_plen_51_part_00
MLEQQAALVEAESAAARAKARAKVQVAVEQAMASGTPASNPFARSEFRGR